MEGHFPNKVKINASHARCPALGPELIPVYRQSARRCLSEQSRHLRYWLFWSQGKGRYSKVHECDIWRDEIWSEKDEEFVEDEAAVQSPNMEYTIQYGLS